MPHSAITSSDQLPVILKVGHVQELMGISKDSAYQLMHRTGVPVVRVGRSIRVHRDALLRWIEAQNDVEFES